MKKYYAKGMLSFLLLGSLLVGCSNNNSANKTDTAQEGSNDWPKETVTLVVPYGAGGDTDTYARQLALQLQNDLGQNFVVVNTTGGAGVIASTSVLDSKPDGNTALFHHTGVMLTQEAAEANEFSFMDDFEMVASVARDDTYALIAKADSEWKTLEDMIAWAKEHPGELKYSSTYYGATHAVAELMEQSMGIEMNQIDVGSGTSDRLTAFIQNQCDVLVVNYMNIADYVEKGDFVVLGICAEERPEGLEDFPTLKEQGYDVVMSKIYEVRLPKGTDASIVEKFSESIEKVTETDEFKEILKAYYAQPYYRNAETANTENLKEIETLKGLFAEK